MTINRKPYKIGDDWFLDVDPNDEVNYVWNVTQWLIDNSTSAASFTLVPEPEGSVTVLEKGSPQGDRSGLLPAKLKVDFTGTPTPLCTARVKTADGQQFDKTINFKKVQN